MPAIGNSTALCKSFIQKADHFLQAVLGLVKLFYGDNAGKAWFESLAQITNQKYGPDDEFAKFMAEALPFLQFVRNARNCIDHPKPAQRVVVRDFALNSEMKIIPPTIEVIHPKSHQPPIAIARFMTDVIEQTSGIFELMIAFMCAKHVQTFAGMPFQIIELPENQRPQKHFASLMEIMTEYRLSPQDNSGFGADEWSPRRSRSYALHSLCSSNDIALFLEVRLALR